MKSLKLLVFCLFIVPTLVLAQQEIGPNLYLMPDNSIQTYDSRRNLVPLKLTNDLMLEVSGQKVPRLGDLEMGLLKYYCSNFARAFANGYRLIYLLRSVSNTPSLQTCKQSLINTINQATDSTAKAFYLNQVQTVARAEPDPAGKIEVVEPGGTTNHSPIPAKSPPTAGTTTIVNPPPVAAKNQCEVSNQKRAAGQGPVLFREGEIEVVGPAGETVTHDGQTNVDGSQRPETSASLPLFCTNPEAAICDEACAISVKGETDTPTTRRRQRFHEILAIAGLQPTDLTDTANPRRLENWRKFFIALRQKYADKIALFPKKVKEWKDTMKAMFKEDKYHSGMAAWIGSKMDNVNSWDESHWMFPQNATNAQVEKVIDSCGRDGLSKGAYNWGTTYIGFCPANFIDLGEDSEFDYTCTHELCHCIDGAKSETAPMFAHFESCLQQIDLKGAKMGKSIAERGADLIAAELFAYKARKQTPEQAFKNLVRGLGSYCPGVGGGKLAVERTEAQIKKDDAASQANWDDHPDRNFQFNFLFGRNPDLRKKFGCTRVSANYPYCGRGGKYPPAI